MTSSFFLKKQNLAKTKTALNKLQNGNVISYNLRIKQEYFQLKIGRKIRIFSLGRKSNILTKKNERTQ